MKRSHKISHSFQSTSLANLPLRNMFYRTPRERNLKYCECVTFLGPECPNSQLIHIAWKIRSPRPFPQTYFEDNRFKSNIQFTGVNWVRGGSPVALGQFTSGQCRRSWGWRSNQCKSRTRLPVHSKPRLEKIRHARITRTRINMAEGRGV